MSKQSFNPNGPTLLRCPKCQQVFSTAIPKRELCVKCKPVSKKELAQLLDVGGITRT